MNKETIEDRKNNSYAGYTVTITIAIIVMQDISVNVDSLDIPRLPEYHHEY